MYRRVLLAYDGSVEGRAALREGALLAKTCGADVFLLSVVGGGSGMRMAEGTQAGAIALQREKFKAVLEEGVERLRAIGFSPVARLVVGDATDAISQFAKEIKADLVVVGHRRQSFLERWWSGPTGAMLMDQVDCSLLVGRNTISDEAFAQQLERSSRP